jgi:hypothetical protein
MMHRLPIDDHMVIAQLAERAFRKLRVGNLGFLKAQYVGRFFAQEAFDNVDAGADRVDVPGSDTKGGCHGGCLGMRAPEQEGSKAKKQNPHPGGIWDGGRACVRHAETEGPLSGCHGQQGENRAAV